MGKTIVPSSVGRSRAQIACGQTEMPRMCMGLITDCGPLPWGQVDICQLQRPKEKSRKKKEASKVRPIYKPHCFLIISHLLPRIIPQESIKLRPSCAALNTQFLKRRSFLSDKEWKYDMYPQGAKRLILVSWFLFCDFTYFFHVWLLSHQWLKKISVCQEHNAEPSQNT